MNATALLALGLVVLTLGGCVGAGPDRGRRASCYDDNRRDDPTGVPYRPLFFFFCVQSP